MRFSRLIVVALGGMVAYAIPHAPIVLAQSAAATPATPSLEGLRFEAVSIKRNTSGSGSVSSRTLPDGGYMLTNGSLRSLISAAYRETVDAKTLPAWMTDEHYDVTATSSLQGTTSQDQRQAMMRTLLTERFNFKAHVEMHEEPAYDLVLARKDGRLGPNMKPSPVDCIAFAAKARAARAVDTSPALPAPPAADAPAADCSFRMVGNVMEGDTQLSPTGLGLLTAIRAMAGRPVIDKTGLTGYYRIRLEALRLRQPGADSTNSGIDDPPDIFSALPAQLGLKLEKSTTVVSTLVVDRIERPAEN